MAKQYSEGDRVQQKLIADFYHKGEEIHQATKHSREKMEAEGWKLVKETNGRREWHKGKK